MSHFGDYMDDVPVKISEKYKRPPRIDLPYSVTECPARAKRVVETARYCSTFERNILPKIKELRSAKEIKKSERRHRLQLLEEAKQKKLDAIAAAETEEKLKQLSVSDVSYPSTDEISAISPDEPNIKFDTTCDTSPMQNNSPDTDTPADVSYPSTKTETQQNILQPIQVQSNFNQNNLLDDPDPLDQIKLTLNNKTSKAPQSNQNVEKLTVKDFENDTSSPFDNVELKTINDMELLAQVLQSQRESAASCQPQPQPTYNQTYPEYANCATQAQMEGVTYLPNAYLNQPVTPGIIYATPPHYALTNGYYIPEVVCDNPIPVENVYVPNYHYIVPAQPYPVADPYYNQLPTTSGDVSQVPNGSSYIPHPYYFHCPHVPMQYVEPPYNPIVLPKNVGHHHHHHHHHNPHVSTQSTVKSRSRSVTDIIQEMNEELDSAQLQALDRCTSPGGSRRTGTNDGKYEKAYWKKVERLHNPLQSLPPLQQRMCQNIHSMGFPLDRVARMFAIVGDNDKKVIECLLILGELMDLGFTENKATEALTKHDFNRDEALDELIS